MDAVTWQIYIITLKLLSPLHVGYRKLGNLQQTRYYVPARTLWGALTARMTRRLNNQDYIKMGRRIDDNMRFSYFFPIEKKDLNKTVNSKTNSFFWAPNRINDFEWNFLDSYAGSPIDKTRHSSQDRGLHQIEHIMPFSRNGNPVYLIGYVFYKDEDSIFLERLKEELSRIQIGGERNYGWGRVNLVDFSMCKDLFGLDISLDNPQGPLVNIKNNEHIMAHVIYNDKSTLHTSIQGKLEVLAGRNTKQPGKYGQGFEPLLPCWIPGSKVIISKEINGIQFSIGSKGIWEIWN